MSEPLSKIVEPSGLVDFDRLASYIQDRIVGAIKGYERTRGIKLDSDTRAKVHAAIERTIWGHIDSQRSRRLVFWQKLFDTATESYAQYRESIKK
ncbi:MAG: hypothetical protein OXE92_10765 [Bacteroidetes bacterium]|nr:hypothetical protein [Bacteroidota bacterium]MCY4206192.1 hypothetical protein [Bacteroidota bacterium]